MARQNQRELLDHAGRPIKWAGKYPPALDPDHPIFFEQCEDSKGRKWSFWYDPYEAYRWEHFAPENVVFIEGDEKLVGQPLHLLEWQLGPTRELFGWKLVKDGQLTDIRRYKSGNVWVPKKNSKTTWGMVLALAGINLDNHIQAQGYYLCATEDQGEDAGWRIGTAMVRHPEGKLKGDYIAWEDKIDHVPTSSALHLITSSGEGRAGKNPHIVVADEKWEFKNYTALRQLLTGMVNQKNSMMLGLSTCGNDITVPAYKEYERDCKIVEGELKDPRHLAVVWQAPKGADPHDRKVWQMANPGWGVTVNEDSLESIYNKSLDSATDLADFCQMHLGMWVHGAQEFLNDIQWAACRKQYTADDLEGRICYGGIDLASTIDMCAFALSFPFLEDDLETVTFKHLVWYWVPEMTAREKAANDQRYMNWIDEGLLFRTEGNTVDYKAIRDFIKLLAKRFRIERIGYDRKFAHNIIYDLRDDEQHRIWPEKIKEDEPDRLVQINQGEAGMGTALKEFKRLVLRQEVHHDGNKILDWNRGNVKVYKTRGGLELVSKEKSTGKIDGLQATVMAFDLAQRAGAPVEETDVYAERGLFFL